MNAKNHDNSISTKGTVRLPELKLLTGLGRSTIYARLDPKNRGYDCEFPRPIALGGRARGWHLAEVEAWLASRPRIRVIQGEQPQQAQLAKEAV